eukprot:Hpha_TRINITY_DN12399_c0_g1::TRINITY_DN12399_c0_g1_i1::g.155774::m.155774
MKVMKKSVLKKARSGGGTAWDNVLRELALMNKMDHPNVVKLHEVIDDPDDDRIYFVMEYLEGGPVLKVDGRGVCNKALSSEEARDAVRDAARGLAYLHRHHIVHRDVKPDNLLLDAIGRVKLTDFGVSVDCGSEAVAAGLKETEGTPLFLAPEILRGDGAVSGKCGDVWALGVTLYAMIYGSLPWVTTSISTLLDLLHKVPEKDDAERKAGDALARRMLTFDPAQRPTAQEVLEDPFLSLPQGQKDPDYGSLTPADTKGWKPLSFLATRVRSQLKHLSQSARVSAGRRRSSNSQAPTDSPISTPVLALMPGHASRATTRRRSSQASRGESPTDSQSALFKDKRGLSQYAFTQSVYVGGNNNSMTVSESALRQMSGTAVSESDLRRFSGAAQVEEEEATDTATGSVSAGSAGYSTPRGEDTPALLSFTDADGDKLMVKVWGGHAALASNGVELIHSIAEATFDYHTGVLTVRGGAGEGSCEPQYAPAVIPRLVALLHAARIPFAVSNAPEQPEQGPPPPCPTVRGSITSDYPRSVADTERGTEPQRCEDMCLTPNTGDYIVPADNHLMVKSVGFENSDFQPQPTCPQPRGSPGLVPPTAFRKKRLSDSDASRRTAETRVVSIVVPPMSLDPPIPTPPPTPPPHPESPGLSGASGSDCGWGETFGKGAWAETYGSLKRRRASSDEAAALRSPPPRPPADGVQGVCFNECECGCGAMRPGGPGGRGRQSAPPQQRERAMLPSRSV